MDTTRPPSTSPTHALGATPVALAYANDAPASPATGSLRRDLVAAYAAAGAKVLSWAVVSAAVYRASPAAFALLALVRGTLGLLTYTTLGLAPGLVRMLAEGAPERDGSTEADNGPLRRPYATGVAVAALAAGAGLVLTFAYAWLFDDLHRVPPGIPWGVVIATVVGMGVGTVLRLASDAPAAVLQTRGRIASDNGLLFAADLSWAAIGVLALVAPAARGPAVAAMMAGAYSLTGAALLLMRMGAAGRFVGSVLPRVSLVTRRDVGRLLAFGGMVTVAQLADFLYAPTDYILINRLIDPAAVAVYAPAVQVDAALLLVVGGLSAVLLPRAALAHAAGDRAALRRYYVRGTLASVALLAGVAVAVWLASGVLLQLWLGDPLPQTRAILPLMLVHTVVGGSAAVGRAVLLGMGRATAFAASVLVAGAANVLLSFTFVYAFGWGLHGIVLGTIVAVVGRAGVWTPWYVLRTLGKK